MVNSSIECPSKTPTLSTLVNPLIVRFLKKETRHPKSETMFLWPRFRRVKNPAVFWDNGYT